TILKFENKMLQKRKQEIDVKIHKLPIYLKRTKIMPMGSNDFGELGLGNDVEKLKILDILKA
ncbi:26386_t:CDS:1, partial [Gigaspora margarita]